MESSCTWGVWFLGDDEAPEGWALRCGERRTFASAEHANAWIRYASRATGLNAGFYEPRQMRQYHEGKASNYSPVAAPAPRAVSLAQALHAMVALQSDESKRAIADRRPGETQTAAERRVMAVQWAKLTTSERLEWEAKAVGVIAWMAGAG